jgi:hypothetical protein
LIASTLFSTIASIAQAAYTPPPPKPPANAQAENSGTALSEITVEADRGTIKQSVVAFAFHVTQKWDVDDSFARWLVPLCPLVAGLPQAPAEFVLERISMIAKEAGVPLADADCRPNLYVVITSQPVAFLKAWRRRDGNLFGNAFPAMIKRFLDSTRPISVWYNDELVSTFDPTPSTITIIGGGQTQYQGFKSKGSRVQFNTVTGISSAMVIVDANKVNGFEIHPIADYVAMVGLLEVNLNADLGRAPSVLHLFEAPERTTGLSAWDQAFLKALYQTDQSSRSQVAAIAESMMQDLAH